MFKLAHNGDVLGQFETRKEAVAASNALAFFCKGKEFEVLKWMGSVRVDDTSDPDS